MSDFEERLKKIAKRVAGYRQQEAMSRPRLVVDENKLGGLVQALREYNFTVRTEPPGTQDRDLAKTLGGSIFITNNAEDFLTYAPIYSFGIIDLQGLPFVDPDPTDQNKTAKLIHEVVTEYSLNAKRGAWILRLKPDGDHIMADLS